MKNTLKLIFLGIIGFAGLVYLTAPEQKVIDKNIKEFNISKLPKHFEVVGNNNYVKKEELFKDKKYFIVLNHDALVLANKLNEFKNIFTVANVSKTPWLIKKLAVSKKLEDLVSGSTISLINDENGSFINTINHQDIKQNAYFVYKIIDKKMSLVYKGDVKQEALLKGLSNDELKNIKANIKKALSL